MPYLVEPMRLEDIPEVAAIERQSFTTPWPVYAYRREIKDNRNSRYIVVRRIESANGRETATPSIPLPEPSPHVSPATSPLRRALSLFFPFLRQGNATPPAPKPPGVVVAYAGLWLIHDEAHVTTIAVRPDLRGSGLGEVMLVRLIEMALEMGAQRMTLEVRASNEVAQGLYRKYTFKVEGVRRKYYSDDNEDALIMWSEPLASPEFQARLVELRAELFRRLAGKLAKPTPS